MALRRNDLEENLSLFSLLKDAGRYFLIAAVIFFQMAASWIECREGNTAMDNFFLI
jgi:hypothetical protein